MDIKYLSFEEEVLKQRMLHGHIDIEMMLANLLTKRFPPKIFVYHFEQMALWTCPC